MLNGKITIVLLIVGLISKVFEELKVSGGRLKAGLDLINYATKADSETATEVDASKFAKKVHIASLKPEVDKSDFDKLEEHQLV